MKIKSIMLGLMLAVFVCGTSFAAPSYYTAGAVLPGGLGTLTAERALFQTAAGANGVTLSTEGFESFSSGSSSLNFGAFTASLGSGSFNQYGNNLITTQGSYTLGFNTPTSVTFAFNSAINAFGVDITSIDYAGTNVSFYDNLGNQLGSFINFPGWAGAYFFGVYNNQAFSSVRFDFVGSEIINFDYLEYGSGSTSVPEPVSLILLGLGIAGLAAVRRKSNA